MSMEAFSSVRWLTFREIKNQTGLLQEVPSLGNRVSLWRISLVLLQKSTKNLHAFSFPVFYTVITRKVLIRAIQFCAVLKFHLKPPSPFLLCLSNFIHK